MDQNTGQKGHIFTCTKCSSVFSQLTAKDTHMKFCKGNTKRYYCLYCQKVCVSQKAKDKHHKKVSKIY